MFEAFNIRLANWVDQYFESRADFARKMEVAPTVVNRWLNTDAQPSLQYLYKMATLGIDVYWVLTGRTQNEVKISFVTDEAESPKGTRIQQLQGEVAHLQARVTELETEINVLRTSNSSLVAKLENANDMVERLAMRGQTDIV